MHEIEVGPNYPLFQLAKAFNTKANSLDDGEKERMSAKIRKWEQLLAGMYDGSISVGSRTPVNAPEWVTLEVLTGGFATGRFLAGGELCAHELRMLDRMGISRQDPRARTYLNTYFLSDDGIKFLSDLFESGCYEIGVPEEGALLAVSWFLSNQQVEKAEDIIEKISPYFDTLRFYPIPTNEPVAPGGNIFLRSVGELIIQLQDFSSAEDVLRQEETISIWLPLYDEFIALFLEAVVGEAPRVECKPDGTLLVDENGRFQLFGETTFDFDDAWQSRLRDLVGKYDSLLTKHSRCRKPRRKNSSLFQIVHLSRILLNKSHESDAILFGRLALILGRYASRNGLPGSARNRRIRDDQAKQIAGPIFEQLALLIVSHLKNFDSKQGIENYEYFIRSFESREMAENSQLPAYFTSKIRKSMAGPINVLITEGVITSGDTLATVLPQVSSHIQAAGIPDQKLRRLYSSLYQAFRRRRSLLLLNLETQVQLREIPWVQKLADLKQRGLDGSRVATESLREIVEQTIVAFPHAILPNKLLQEVRAMSTSAALKLPIVDELAADIFMGSFSPKFAEAANIAGTLLTGTVYERYYSIEYQEIARLIRKAPKKSKSKHFSRVGAPGSDAFAGICERRAANPIGASSVAANGTIIEQQQILTTQNLAVLFKGLNLTSSLQPQLRVLSERCFHWICRRQQMKIQNYHARLVMTKNTAYAWRQMIFYISLLPAGDCDAFSVWLRDTFNAQSDSFKTRFRPAIDGLLSAIDGTPAEPRGRVFLGWSVGKHWILENWDQ
ncbi:MAG: hypothetical protein NXI24_00005 [bacterium]|nr:hypothetical protein [bacterium]